MTYSAPSITDLGSVRSLTQQSLNKEGSSKDFLSDIPIPPTGDTLDGSFVNDPV